MIKKANLEAVYVPSEDVVAREIEGEIIIVPIVSGVGDMEDELFTLNETGKSIWQKLDGRRKLKDIIEALSGEFKAPLEEINEDVVGLASELLKRRIIIEAPKG